MMLMLRGAGRASLKPTDIPLQSFRFMLACIDALYAHVAEVDAGCPARVSQQADLHVSLTALNMQVATCGSLLAPVGAEAPTSQHRP
jgi:ABC-type transport system involved in cytochrome c biogenesis permease subunit